MSLFSSEKGGVKALVGRIVEVRSEKLLNLKGFVDFVSVYQIL